MLGRGMGKMCHLGFVLGVDGTGLQDETKGY